MGLISWGLGVWVVALSQLIDSSSFAMIANRRVDNAFEEKLGIDRKAIVPLNRVKGAAVCTGTFLNSSTVLTAAHCVDTDLVTRGVVVEGIASINYFFPEKHEEINEKQLNKAVLNSDRLKHSKYDIAIVVFPLGTAEALGVESFPSISSKIFQKDDEITLFGYGMEVADESQFTTLGYLGWTETSLSQIVAENVGVTKMSPLTVDYNKEVLGKGGYALPGDSGGPSFNSNGEVVGVTSLLDKAANQFEMGLLTLGQALAGAMPTMAAMPKMANNSLVSVSTKVATDLYEKAILCDTPNLCASNFENSGVPTENASITQEINFPASPPSVWVKRGMYANEKNEKDSLQVMPLYVGSELKEIRTPFPAAKDKKGAKRSITFGCTTKKKKVSCVAGRTKIEVLDKGEKLGLYVQEPQSALGAVLGGTPEYKFLATISFLKR